MVARQFSFLALLALTITLLVQTWSTPDVWYHLALGREILATGSLAPPDSLILKSSLLINIYWLFQIALFSIFHLGGVAAVSAFFGMMWLATLAIWTRGIGRWGGWLFPLAFLAMMTMRSRFSEQRPEVVSYLLLTWMLTRLHRPNVVAFGIVEAVWANCHSYFVLGPLITGWRMLTAERPREHARLFAVVTAASCASPLGVRTWQHAWRALANGRGAGGVIAEMNSPLVFLSAKPVLWFAIAFGAVVATLVVTSLPRARERIFAVSLAVAGLVAGLSAFRFLPLAAIFALPLLRVCAREAPAPRAALKWSAGLASLLFAGWVVSGGFYEANGSGSAFGSGLARSTYAIGFGDYLDRAGGFSGKLFNDAQTGGYLEFRFPRLRLYGDSRFMAPGDLVNRYLAAPMDLRALKSIDEEETFDGFLFCVANSAEAVARFLRNPKFVLAYADLYYAFFVRRAVRVPLATPHFYGGEDLWRLENRLPALRWAQILGAAPGAEGLMARAVRDWSVSPRLPTAVVGYALNFAHAHADAELAAISFAMVPRARELAPGDDAQLRELAKYLGERGTMR